ncbi:MAG: CPBP family intramembrane metalloprotease [Roseivirga sp.]|nr:CPBP family intramembrane metalloprotease [Roseivirga sp.]
MSYGLIFFALLAGVIFPLYAFATARKTQAYMHANPDKLIQTYKSILVMQWGMCLPVVIMLSLKAGGLSSIGLHFFTDPLSIAGLVATVILGAQLVKRLPYPEKRLIKGKKKLKEVMFVLPKNKAEHQWSLGVSVTAGVCEEILFRGLFYELLLEHTTAIFAILIVNIMFGLGHAGTKFKNMLSTMGLGLLWSAIYYFTGSLWVPIAMHILVDVYSLTLGLKVYQYDQQIVNQVEKTADAG